MSLSVWKRLKAVGRSVVRRFGVFFGIIRSDELDDIQDKIQQRLQDGEYGISVNNLFSRKSSNKYKLALQVEEALSQVLINVDGDDDNFKLQSDSKRNDDFEMVETIDSEISLSMESVHLDSQDQSLTDKQIEQSQNQSDHNSCLVQIGCSSVENTGGRYTPVENTKVNGFQVEHTSNKNSPVEYTDSNYTCVEYTSVEDSEYAADLHTIEVKEASLDEISNLYPSKTDQSNSVLRENKNPDMDKNKSANESDDSESKKSEIVTDSGSKVNIVAKSKSDTSVLVTSRGNSALAEAGSDQSKMHSVLRSISEGAVVLAIDSVKVDGTQERNIIYSSDHTSKDDLNSESELNDKFKTVTSDFGSEYTVQRSSVSIDSINIALGENITSNGNDVKMGKIENSKINLEKDSNIIEVANTSATNAQLGNMNLKESRETSREELSVVNEDVNVQQPEQDDMEEDKKAEKCMEFESVTRTQEDEINDEESDRLTGINNNPNSTQWDNKSDSEEHLNERDFAYGQEAYHHYKLFVEIEKKIKIRELEESKERKVKILKWNIEQIDEIIKKAKAYYMDPTGEPAKDWKELWKSVEQKSRTNFQKYPKSLTDIRVKLSQMPVYLPLFTIFIIFAQLVSFGVICGLGGLTYIGLEPKLELQNGIKTFLGTETVHKWVPPNIWIGPSELYMISVGATFSPCMREDIGITIDSTKMNYSIDTTLGCCEVAFRNTAGTTTQEECTRLTNGVGKWKENTLCSERPSGHNNIEHNLKPCCINTKGVCTLMSHKHCTFIGGLYHQKGPEHCSKVNCLSNICGFGGFSSKPDQPWLPEKPAHWWRFLLSLLYHHGIIHTVLVVIVQALILRQIEQSAGWFRVMIIYILSGVGGILAAAIFTPYSPHVGGTGALFGFVGVTLVELIQFWRIIQRPFVELVKIFIAIIFFLASGTLPYINNFTIIFGFLIGLLCACAFLPYITFGRWHKRCRIFLVCLTVPLLLLLYFMLFYVFYKVQTVEDCAICNQINCVSYTEKMCNNSLWRS